MEISEQSKEALARAHTEDVAFFEEMKSKIGEYPALMLSELANLAAFTRLFPLMEATVDNLIGATIDGFKLDKEESLACLKRFMTIRTVHVHSKDCSCKKPN